MPDHETSIQALQSLLGIDGHLFDRSPRPSVHSRTHKFNGRHLDVPRPLSIASHDSPYGSSTPNSGASTINQSEAYVGLEYLSWLSVLNRSTGNIISHSVKGSSYDYLGCFPLGSAVTRRSFDEVAFSQEVSNPFPQKIWF